MLRILLTGCNGKMGRTISSMVFETPNLVISAGVDIQGEGAGGYPVFCSLDACTVPGDVVVDFSHPSAFQDTLSFCMKHGLPLVMATTGLSDAQKVRLEESSRVIPVFYSANMSMGVNLLIRLAKTAARFFGEEFDVEIIEKHHNQKIDAPSGTAVVLAEEINKVLPQKKEYVYDRHSRRERRSKDEIGIHTIRGGTITGEHTVIFAGRNEVVELTHQAASREVFAAGAIRAAQFIQGKPKGMYSMEDMFDTP
ncbi:MAG: 4-hydroxy-tetrahydrodipicolinate reductase [Clostridia bacterium]